MAAAAAPGPRAGWHRFTPRLCLEPLKPAHADEMFRWLAEPAVHHFLDHGPPASAGALRELYERLQAGGSADGRERWLNWLMRLRAAPSRPAAEVEAAHRDEAGRRDACTRDDGAAIGHLQATVFTGGRACIAYQLDPAQWGRGLATEAVPVLIDELARRHRVRQCLAVIEIGNARSAALLRRLGFEAAAIRSTPEFGDLSASEQLWTLDLARRGTGARARTAGTTAATPD